MEKKLTIDGLSYTLSDEKNVLEIARKVGIEIPTFCYHSELSVYGGCRMCLVDIEGRGIVTSCSTPPEPGMVIRTNTKEVRDIRRINLELLLANHERECTTCLKSGACSLQNLTRKMGVDNIRFKATHKPKALDLSSKALVRNPNKCVLCGDCVRFCDEIQSVGAIDVAFRGAQAEILPAFGKPLGEVECVDCGQCSRVCPTGAIIPKSEIEPVWDMLGSKNLTVVAQVAPAIRVALGEYFGLPAGTITTGKIATALRRLGFHKVYDTCFTADLTVLEEGREFIDRLEQNVNLPLFTSCCPAWVKFTEQYYPDLLPNLSTCRSPQQMFGSLVKKLLPSELGIDPNQLRVVSIMPCTAKKNESSRKEFRDTTDNPDIHSVLTSQELGRMIEAAGINFVNLKDEPFDLPFGLASGAGTIFGTSGGVTEAVVRFVADELKTGVVKEVVDEPTNTTGIREYELTFGDKKIKAAVVFGLKNARRICRDVRKGINKYQIIEIMACPGGCINGAGQPVTFNADIVSKRGMSLYQIDANQPIRASQDNPALRKIYENVIGPIGGHKAHELLHTTYTPRKRIKDGFLQFDEQPLTNNLLTVEVCVGTNCCLHGAHDLLKQLLNYVDHSHLQDKVTIKAAFCFELCSGESPVVRIKDEVFTGCTLEMVTDLIHERIKLEHTASPVL